MCFVYTHYLINWPLTKAEMVRTKFLEQYFFFNFYCYSITVVCIFSPSLHPKCPSANEWIQKLWYIYTIEFYTAERKKELIPFATAWMELESIILSEISQTVRDKYHMISPWTVF